MPKTLPSNMLGGASAVPVWDGKQAKVLLQGCPAEQITSLVDREFTDFRVTRKWFDAVEVGDTLPCHTSVKPEGFEPLETTYPGQGEFIYNVVVVAKELFKTPEEAFAASEENHFVLAGNSVDELKDLIGSIYPETALDRAVSDPEDGFTVLTLKLA